MMRDDPIGRMLERYRQGIDARVALAYERRQLMTAGVTRVDRLPAAGTRVFDTVSGQEGEVISGGTENVLIPDPRR